MAMTAAMPMMMPSMVSRLRILLLRTLAKADLSTGGRVISNMVETQLVNPLAQILAQAACHAGNTLVIQGADPAAPGGLTYHIE